MSGGMKILPLFVVLSANKTNRRPQPAFAFFPPLCLWRANA
jgi:hypothetical protein